MTKIEREYILSLDVDDDRAEILALNSEELSFYLSMPADEAAQIAAGLPAYTLKQLDGLRAMGYEISYQ